jgi:hypothetical protein
MLLMQTMEDSSLRLIYDCRFAKIGPSIHRLSTELVLNGR